MFRAQECLLLLALLILPHQRTHLWLQGPNLIPALPSWARIKHWTYSPAAQTDSALAALSISRFSVPVFGMDFSQLLPAGSLLLPPQHPSREQVAPLLSMRSWSCHKAGGAVFTSPGWERGVGSPGNNAGSVEHVAGRAARGQRRFPCRWCVWAARVGHLSPATSPTSPVPQLQGKEVGAK